VEHKLATAVDEPSLATAIERLMLASQRVLFARLDLLLLEMHDALTRGLRALLLGGIAIGVALGGWFAMLTGFVLALDDTIGQGPSLFIVGIANFALAIGTILWLVRDSRQPPRVSAQALPEVGATVEAGPQRVTS
jgi:uncharacterized membrane protein YqjE